jgi:hypothetical protein
MGDYIHFEPVSPKTSSLGYFTPSDGSITVNLDEITDMVEEMYYCNTENVIIDVLIDVLIHEELHKRFDEANETHDVINEQDERIFKVITLWVEQGKIYSSKV